MLSILLNKAFWTKEKSKKFENDIVHNRNAKINYIGGKFDRWSSRNRGGLFFEVNFLKTLSHPSSHIDINLHVHIYIFNIRNKYFFNL
jgi:hypothetical protein